MSLIFSHPTGNANSRAAVSAFMEAGILVEFQTAIASFYGSLLDRLGAIGPLSEIRRRRFDPALRPITHVWPWLEMGRLMASKAGFTKLVRHETGPFSIDAVYQSLDRRMASRLKEVSRRGVSAVYAYEDGAVASFREAKRLGFQCLYDLPIGYWRAAHRLLENERNRWPDWIPTLVGFDDSEAKLARKDEELQLSDRIFVASQFTAKTLQEFPGDLAPIDVIPYGFPSVGKARDYSTLSSSRRLKLLFVGGLSQRKGIADLFAAIQALGHCVELTIVGLRMGGECPALETALAKHNWIPSLPHADILKLMQAHDVLVFPSLFEGFGLVITESMSQGTPVITTDRTAGPDLIKHGQNGWLVEAGSTMALQAAIQDLLTRPASIAEAGKAAMETARLRPWDVYGQELATAIIRHQIG
jgi:glycosyltransferase involved in cell wall biosynthesis